MIRRKIVLRSCIASISVIALPYFVFAAADSAAQIQELLKQLQALQTQLTTLQTQQNFPIFTQILRRGMRNEEVKRLQTFLAALPDIYPEGLVTGYFGTLTEAAVKRFQTQHAIEAVGFVGPKTRQALNTLLGEKNQPAPPLPEPAPIPTPAPLPPPPATSTPPVPPTQPPATGPIPTQNQLGLPSISSFVWSNSALKIQFTHDPGVIAKSYAIYLTYPNQPSPQKFGPYAIPALNASTTAAGGSWFTRTSVQSWEWILPVDISTQADGTYEASITAVGEGSVESVHSAGQLAYLYAASPFDDLLQGSSSLLVKDLKVTELPIAIRLKNPITELYYLYTIYDGNTKIWDGGNITKADRVGAQADFTNQNSYPLVSGNTYRIHAESYSNNIYADSWKKQKPNDLVFTYTPPL